MPIIYDKTTDGLYLEGMEANRYQLIKNALLRDRYTVEHIAEMFEVSIEFVLNIKAEIEDQ